MLEMTKDNKILTTLLITILLLFLSLSGCIKENNMNNRITAKSAFDIGLEKKNKSIEFSYNMSDVFIDKIWAGGDISGKGKADVWHCSYSVKKNQEKYLGLYLKVFGNKTVNTINKEYFKKEPSNYTKNWTIDSDKAIKIAKSNDEISKYLSKYEDAGVDHLQLDMYRKYSKNDATWKIAWMYNAGLDNPVWAESIINAHTGEVLYAEADN